MKRFSRLTLVLFVLVVGICLTTPIMYADPVDKVAKALKHDPRIQVKPNDGRDWYCVYVYEPGTFSKNPAMFAAGEYTMDGLIGMRYVLNTWKQQPPKDQVLAVEAARASVYNQLGMEQNRPDLINIGFTKHFVQLDRASLTTGVDPISATPLSGVSFTLEGRPFMIIGDPGNPVPCVGGTTVCTADVCGRTYCSGAHTDCGVCG